MSRQLLVTSALPYANGPLHLGHMLEYIQTDIFVRFHRSYGNTCYYVCADDSHGTPIMLSAQKKGVSPDVYINQIYKDHCTDFARFNIQFDHYGQTHCDTNQQLSNQFYAAAQAKQAIYTKAIQQLYCTTCQLFLPDRLIKGQCTRCQAADQYGDVCEQCGITHKPTDLQDPYCVHCQQKPIEKTSHHYFFSLKDHQNFLMQWVDATDLKPAVKNKLSEWFKTGLTDWDISRDPPYFGFQIPNSDQYFYVWVDAPLGYIAMTQRLDLNLNLNLWESSEIHHFIGKDILYFHGLFWPAMLFVMGYNLPSHLHVHGFLTVNNEKMSKSRGTFLLAKDFAYPAELLRYYYAAKLSGDMRDIDFNEQDFVYRINADVLGKLVNIGSRICAILKKKTDNRLSVPDEAGQAILQRILDEKETIRTAYETLNYTKATQCIMRLAELVNGYIHTQAPWDQPRDQAQQIGTAAIHAWRYLAIYTHPILPDLTEKIGKIIGASIATYTDLTPLPSNHQINHYYHIIKRLKPVVNQ